MSDQRINSKPTEHFGRAPQFVLVDLSDGKIENWSMVENPSAEMGKKRGIIAANLLVEQKVDALLTRELGGGPFHTLRDNLIRVYRLPEATSIKDAVHTFISQDLELMLEPTKD